MNTRIKASEAYFLVAVCLLAAANVHASERTYAGMFTSGWRTEGWHGHDQPPCAPPRHFHFGNGFGMDSPNCDSVDFARGNLDNNIGFRGGREWDLVHLGRLSLVAGAEASVSNTEYNLSQSDFAIASAIGIGGFDVALRRIRVGARAGIGPFMTSDSREHGLLRTISAHVTLPLTSGAAVRIARHSMSVLGSEKRVQVYNAVELSPDGTLLVKSAPRAFETSFLLVTSPEYVGSSHWEYSTATGSTNPGGPLGSSRKLRISNFSQMSATRQLPWRGWEGRIVWTASAHESSRPTVFEGYDHNYRSKTINSFGLNMRRTVAPFSRLSLHYGAGVEAADWRDEHHLLTRDEQTLVAGVETAMTAHVAARWHFAQNLAFETFYEKAYWRNIDLGENRLGFGLVITSFSTPPSSARNR